MGRVIMISPPSLSLSSFPALKRPRAILFDHDGVLVASEPLHESAWEALMKELGLPPVSHRFRMMVGKTAPEILTRLMDESDPHWDRSRLSDWVQRKNDLYLELAKTALKPYPGVLEGLRWMKENGIRAGVVSNARKRELQVVLKALGLAPFFDATISREEAGRAKPDPAPYLMGAACLEVSPGDCFAIEDSPPGLEAALLARIPAFAVTTTFEKSHLMAPVPGRADLKPIWIGTSIAEFFEGVRTLAAT